MTIDDEFARCESCDAALGDEDTVECDRCHALVCPKCVLPGDDVTGDWCEVCDGVPLPY